MGHQSNTRTTVKKPRAAQTRATVMGISNTLRLLLRAIIHILGPPLGHESNTRATDMDQ